MEEKIKETLFIISERKLFDSIQATYELCAVAKTFRDEKIVFHCLKLFGCLLMHREFYD